MQGKKGSRENKILRSFGRVENNRHHIRRYHSKSNYLYRMQQKQKVGTRKTVYLKKIKFQSEEFSLVLTYMYFDIFVKANI